MNQGPLKFERSDATSIRPAHRWNPGCGSNLAIRSRIEALNPPTPDPLLPALIGRVGMPPWKFACQANIGAMSPEKRGST